MSLVCERKALLVVDFVPESLDGIKDALRETVLYDLMLEACGSFSVWITSTETFNCGSGDLLSKACATPILPCLRGRIECSAANWAVLGWDGRLGLLAI